MNTETIGMIGAGNMASSQIHGLIAKGISPGSLYAADPDQLKLDLLAEKCGINIGSNQTLAATVDVLVLAVKPQVLRGVCRQLDILARPELPLVISVAAGIPLGNLEQWLGDNLAITRCMPNTPALIGKGASGLFANPQTSVQQRELAESIMEAVGIAVWVDNEQAIDAVTALSGSGPAYYFLFLETMQAAARELGLSESVAKQLGLQTAHGAIELALHSKEDVAELRRQVTSPGGTTEQALLAFENGGLRALVHKALSAANQRSKELAREYGES